VISPVFGLPQQPPVIGHVSYNSKVMKKNMKPVSASDILRKTAPRETLGQTFLHTNRYEHLRESSPAPSARQRSDSAASILSQKRKGDEDFFCDESNTNKSKVSRLDCDEEEQLVILDSKISKVSTLCGKMYTVVQQQQLQVDDPLRSLLADLIEAVKVTNEVQSELSGKYKSVRLGQLELSENQQQQAVAISYSSVAAGGSKNTKNSNGGKETVSGSRKLPKEGLVPIISGDKGKTISSQPKIKPVETEEEKKVRRFGEAICDAERSTLIFNLNMGNVPLMNKETISEKASLALTKMAAAKEGKNRSVPSPDLVAAIDDVTSLVTNMEFYGTSTKEYKGKDSTGFCTVPVKYQFKDRDQKVFAEKTLRDKCNVKCATPYPAIVRECIKQVIEHVRQSHPGDFIRVGVNVKEFALKVSRRPPGKDLKWIEYPELLPLPLEAWNVSAKKCPDGLRMFFLPTEDMSTSPVLKSPKGSRKDSQSTK
jgi:hypothetical protein